MFLFKNDVFALKLSVKYFVLNPLLKLLDLKLNSSVSQSPKKQLSLKLFKIKKNIPKVKLFVFVCDPVKRLYSNLKHCQREEYACKFVLKLQKLLQTKTSKKQISFISPIHTFVYIPALMRKRSLSLSSWAGILTKVWVGEISWNNFRVQIYDNRKSHSECHAIFRTIGYRCNEYIQHREDSRNQT